MKILYPVTLLLILCTAPTAAQLTIAENGAVTVRNSGALTARQLIVKDGASLTLGEEASYVYADEVSVEDGGTVTIRGFLAWDDAITLAGTTVFQLADDPNTFEFGVSDGAGTATLGGELITELVDGYDPEDPVSFIILSAGNLSQNGPTETLPNENWFYTYDDNFLRANFDASVLPVEWLGFAGRWSGKNTQLDWQTANETASDFFEVQRQNATGTWQIIGNLAAAGTAVTTSSYDFLDEDPGPTNPILYRLRQVDLDGGFSYSDVVSLHRSELEGAITVFPNPARDHLFVDGLAAGDFWITDAVGRQVAQGRMNDDQRFRIDLPDGLATGTYFLRTEKGVAQRFTVSR